MQMRVENRMKVSGHQIQGKRLGGDMMGGVLNVGGKQGASVVRPLARSSHMAGLERDGGNRLTVPPLASFAGAKRSQLALLTEASVVAALREVVTGVTCLASVRPMSPRLTAAPIVLARGTGFSPGRVSRGVLVEPAHSHDDELVDEGGIYSW